MGNPRGELFAKLDNNDTRFPNIVHFQPVANRQDLDYISVTLDVDWPSTKNGPLLFRDIEDGRQKLPIFNLIFSIKSFLERALLTDLELIEIRTGCIKVVYRLNQPVPASIIRAGLDKLLKNKERYHAFDASSRVGKRRVY